MGRDLSQASTAELEGELIRRGAIGAPSEARARRRILTALADQDVTQAVLARRLGVTEKHVSRVLLGRAGLSFDLADRMLAALGKGPLIPEEVPSDGHQ
jgi:ParB-like chromosome segregation protein Spo0J